jgi:hypothetical protein
MTKLTIKGSKGTYNTGNIVLSTSNLVYVQLEVFFNILIEQASKWHKFSASFNDITTA